MSRGFIRFVSGLTPLRNVRSETAAFCLAFFLQESHETNVRCYEAKGPFFGHPFSSRFPRVFRQKSHVSHPYREVMLGLPHQKLPGKQCHPVKTKRVTAHRETTNDK
jgi:hypothetical protein